MPYFLQQLPSTGVTFNAMDETFGDMCKGMKIEVAIYHHLVKLSERLRWANRHFYGYFSENKIDTEA